ncbi:MAG: 1-acyl-sn-glycerol-3-phosphate acyltransferase [Proteobacteria bacterium]|nr:1-acyl-sn-glycerol-3-phosphate acyltransferase [Pseudomonadota bacterium]
MGHVLSLRTVYELARVTVPTFVESFFGQVESSTVDERIVAFATRVVANAQIDIRTEGREQIAADRSYVYMSNHQSHMDIPVLYATVPARTMRAVAKKELFRIPVWGRAMRAAGIVEVDRQHRNRAIASLGDAADQLRRGTSIWIAPEGTRSRTGRLGRLKKGGFHLAKQAGVPIVPIAITGTHAILPPGTTSTRPGCPVRVVFGIPIEVEGREVAALMGEVEAFFRANCT